MKRILPIVALLAGTSQVQSQRLLTEDFNYTPGQLTSANSGANVSGGNWVSSSGTANYLPVVAGSLTYTGYSTGASATNNNRVSLVATSTSAEDAYRDFTPQTSGIVYMSVLVSITDQTRLAENTATPGDFFTGFLASNAVVGSTTTFAGGRVYIRKGSAPNTINFGVSANAPTGGTPTAIMFSPTDYAIGVTHLITLAYQINPGDFNDEARLFINKPVSLSEPTPDAISTYAGSTAVEPIDIARIFIRQGTATANGFIDAFKVSTNYYDATLPLTLISFSASRVEKVVQLNWTTAHEQQVKLYGIERSHNGRDFVAIGNLNAKNISRATYNFTDNSPLSGTAYYRLLMLDKDGSKAYSSIVIINNKQGLISSLSPNPAKHNITISHEKAGIGAVLTIVDGAGRKLKTEAVAPGASQSTLGVNQLLPGNYILLYDNNGDRSVIKFLKQ